MLDLLNKFRRNEDGVAITELAVVTPIFLMMFLSTIELGHMIYYSITIEKGLRSGVTYAGRVEAHTPTTIQNTKNIVKTGTPSGTDPFLVRGWENAGSSVTFTETTFAAAMSGKGADLEARVVHVTADVAYVPVVGVLIPVLERLMKTQFRKGDLYITLTHEQAIIGN
ncbi:MAG: pilus assembly protein [Proteobacteria bacterium]|nr:pilus assembly protein [Pseudomonadota bacterium]